MSTANTCSHTAVRAGHILVFVVAMLSIHVIAARAMAADGLPDDYRLGVAGGEFADTTQVAVAYRLRPPRRLRARYLELAVGTFSTSSESRLFVAVGPVWQLPLSRTSERWFVQFAFAPTLLAGSTFNGRDLGGNVHFTSSATLGAAIGDRRELTVALRLQHTSNGGINNTNPGIDMLGLNLSYSFGR